MRATIGRLFAVRLLGACLAMTMLDACQRYGAEADVPAPVDMQAIAVDRDADPATVAAAERQCTALGGKLQQSGRLGRYACYAQYSDGGKLCGDSSECDGDCRAVDGAETGEAVRGQCTADNVPFGCYAEVENGVVGPYLCVD